MKACFDGIGQWAATFPLEDGAPGQTAALSADGKVRSCTAGESFAGVILAAGRDGGACSLILGGIVSVPCSGDLPLPGWNPLAADGLGGVQTTNNARSYLVVNAENGVVTFVL